MKEFRVDMSSVSERTICGVNYGTTIKANSIEDAREKALKRHGKEYPYIIQIWERREW